VDLPADKEGEGVPPHDLLPGVPGEDAEEVVHPHGRVRRFRVGDNDQVVDGVERAL
jgi:hypothetical protein